MLTVYVGYVHPNGTRDQACVSPAVGPSITQQQTLTVNAVTKLGVAPVWIDGTLPLAQDVATAMGVSFGMPHDWLPPAP